MYRSLALLFVGRCWVSASSSRPVVAEERDFSLPRAEVSFRHSPTEVNSPRPMRLLLHEWRERGRKLSHLSCIPTVSM